MFGDTLVMERTEIAEPSLYDVIIYRDTTTPYEFIGAVLLDIFLKTEDEAINILDDIRSSGKGVAGTYTLEISEIKVDETMEVARSMGFYDFKCESKKN